ncbi:ribosomal-protein-alanine N-acetyltransferase [Chromobacterium sp. ATCC 53434]|uniref:ribosomal protein S18-alanine N-acetyltransferase n=1 Tax=Chromobacterium sp. (strain ATCC 53434 / SC 14030) TaxID=2059672 RepID=UPI000C75FDDD|nr:ribosomal protein S18-alanine N-acetyltransferase [Chromobacterium sp. ATCC 53434]AUH50095.1 ribosomal-protein-alanine N-acetyltransferase [Chromobacterium sp. ATCC 53434]
MSAVRRFQPDDPQLLADMEQQATPHGWRVGQYRDSLAAGYPCYGLFDDADALLGFALIMRVLDEAEVLNIVIAKEYQGRGNGLALLQAVLGDLRDDCCRRLFLEVRESNTPARRLYQRCGFHQCGLRKNYYPAAHGREHAILMEASL